MRDYEITVVGGGPAGLTAACLMAMGGRRVAHICEAPAQGDDPRTIALMQPSIKILDHLGVWAALQGQVASLRRLRIVDDTGVAFRAPTITFDPNEIGEDVFGWNVPLALLIPVLRARATELGIETIAAEVTAARVVGNSIEVTASGESFSARLAIAADGRNSILRRAAGIPCRSWKYEQTAIATSFDHSGEHDGISTEYHRSAGPCTTVPMPGKRSSLVWLERPARAVELMSMADRELAAEIQMATRGDLGRVSGLGPRQAFSMCGLTALNFAGNRTLLVGEAGHVAPPIGAQGLNMAFRDGEDASKLIASADDPGADDVLREYDVLRRRDVGPRQQAIDLMNRSLLTDFVPLEMARAVSFGLIGAIAPLRRYIMRQGLGLPHANVVGN